METAFVSIHPLVPLGIGDGHVAEFIINPRFEDRQSIARAVRTK